MKRLLTKVCGLTRPEDARLAAALGADMLGFIFHPKSPRCVQPAFPASLDRKTDLLGALKVGVFVAQAPDDVLTLMGTGGLDLAQLHGGQDEVFCRALAERLGPERIIKVVWPEAFQPEAFQAGQSPVEAFQAELDRFAPYCRLFLADAGKGGGGHGRVIGSGGVGAGKNGGEADDILALANFPRTWLLAGGLGPANVADMLSRFSSSDNFGGVDLNSGVEAAPGLKDKNLLRDAFKAINAKGRAAQTKGVTP